MRRSSGVPGLVVGLVVLVLAVGIGVWLTSSDRAGGGAAPVEQEDRGDRRDDRLDAAEDRREDRIDAAEERREDRGGSNSGPG